MAAGGTGLRGGNQAINPALQKVFVLPYIDTEVQFLGKFTFETVKGKEEVRPLARLLLNKRGRVMSLPTFNSSARVLAPRRWVPARTGLSAPCPGAAALTWRRYKVAEGFIDDAPAPRESWCQLRVTSETP